VAVDLSSDRLPVDDLPRLIPQVAVKVDQVLGNRSHALGFRLRMPVVARAVPDRHLPPAEHIRLERLGYRQILSLDPLPRVAKVEEAALDFLAETDVVGLTD